MTAARARGAALLLLLLAAAAAAATQETLFSPTGSGYFETEEGDYYGDTEDCDNSMNMSVSALGPTELLVSWTCECNETSSFEVAWSPSSEVGDSNATTYNTNYTITGLTPCSSYTVHVVEVTNDTMTGSCATETATTDRQNVSNVTVDTVANDSSQLDVSWEEEPGNCSSSFRVTWGLPDGTWEKDLTNSTEYSIEDLEAFTQYNVCVASFFNDAAGQPMCGENRTAEDVPDPPVNVTAWPVRAEALKVSWQEPEEPRGVVTSYTVLNSRTDNSSSFPVDVPGTNTSAIIEDLLPCTNYSVVVAASTAAGRGAESDPVSAVPRPAAPDPPTNITVGQLGEHSDALAVSWTQADTRGNCSVTKNRVKWRFADSGDFIDSMIVDATEEVNITGLQSNTVYCVAVAAVVDDVLGPFGECVNGTTSRDVTAPNPDNNSWVVAVSVTVAVVLVAAAGVSMYVFRDKLKRLNLQLRTSSLRSPPKHGVTSPQFQEAIAATAAGEVGTKDLRRYIQRLEEDTQRGLEEEFELVKQQSAQHPALAAVDPSNKGKNRFRNILPFDHSRVVLPLRAGDPSSDYINANYILDCGGRRQFVACQGPTGSTTGDLWRLVWHVGAQVVVMLTNLRERGRERCALYWPTPEEPNMSCEDVTISWQGEAGSDDVRVRDFILQKGEKQRPVRQYHHTTWPDFGVPIHEHHLLDLLSVVRDATTQDGSPVVVHCSAGVGRTGTFIGMWNLMDVVDGGQSSSINVRQTVLEMRECRPNMVQTPEQYLYLYKCIAAYLEQPTRWRRKAAPEVSGVPAEDSCQDYIFAYENPAFCKEALDSGT